MKPFDNKQNPLKTLTERLMQLPVRFAELQKRRMDTYGAGILSSPIRRCAVHSEEVLELDMERSLFESTKAQSIKTVHHECGKCIAEKKKRNALIRRGIPERSLHITLETWDPNWEPVHAEARAAALKEVTDWSRDPRKSFLIILGARGGTGKTALGVAALREFGTDIRFLEFRDCIGRLLAMPCEERQPHCESVREYAGLLIDDFGNRFTGGRDELGGNAFERDVMASILNYRFECSLPTIITSNLSRQDFVARLDDRTADRIRHNRVLIDAADWPSRRAAEALL